MATLRIRLQVPKKYRDQPLMGDVLASCQLQFNILAAHLGPNREEDGWFDVMLTGTSEDITAALAVLRDRDIELWSDTEDEF
ncbi:NIL domain-containing protein [Synechococcus elongatus]|uniref:Uncharacterized protein Synpcc7942_1683 n=1 Tax=Synechococcus elongatus (strain ATCC 33912 / PCC 7942 / FACHB-805) TaxID=1140 RepID=Y1683_SYNE7|nr:NIL domain-containing protein [Synechococcus elongatus]P27368.1 RecName: Full=Uncharacterized protein Synpcc7942_1683; AltName: Full=ORF 81 [Synechococcus elongatus PCC 7942 = FACHB-805]pir/D43670/ hypothetical protein (cysT 3' region) - Synechococcus sp [Synechococcus sp.]AAA73045.1 unknown [Synechococcus elongatus PCC 7942 = FACHB-805]ABB57713.1 conserved hypothetical protein [Synechococcus elongatus PCC 7942 = FACHB-805]AJD57797.1 hypothetical protein M744_08070 [Synechococcus elongatus 